MKKERQEIEMSGVDIRIISSRNPLPGSESMGYGLLATELLRDRIDIILLEDCIGWLTEADAEMPVNRRYMMRLINQLNYSLPAACKREIVQDIGRFTESCVLSVAHDRRTRGTWLLLFGGVPTLSDIITSEGAAWYLDDETYLDDLAIVQKIGHFSRVACLKRLFDSYYDSSDFEEVARGVYDYPCHTIKQIPKGVQWNYCPEIMIKSLLNHVSRNDIEYTLMCQQGKVITIHTQR